MVTVTDYANNVHAFFQDGSHTNHITLEQGVWSEVEPFDLAANLGVAKVPLTNQAIAYGVTSEGNLLFLSQNWSTGNWQGQTCDMDKALAGGQAILQMLDGSNWILAASVSEQLLLAKGIINTHRSLIFRGQTM